MAEPHTFHYLGRDRVKSSKSGLKTGSSIVFGALRKHLKALGCGPRMQQGLFQLLAAILHLGDVQFEVVHRQEYCGVKNQAKLALVARLFGCSTEDLELALTTKSTMVGKEKCSIILGTLEAVQQRDKFAAFLYSLVFSWLVEQMNAQYCMPEEEMYHYIALFDFPGMSQNTKYAFGFEQLLVNFMDEKLSYFAKTQLCDKVWEICDDNALPQLVHELKQIEDQADLVNLLGSPTTGLLTRFVSDPPTSKEMLAITKKNVYLVFDKKKKSAAHFAIRHSVGSIDYKITDINSRPDAFMCADFVSLFSQSSTGSSTNVTFIRHLFTKQLVSVEFDPKSSNTLLKADTSVIPTRRPSVKHRKDLQVTDPEDKVESRAKSPLDVFLASFDSLLANVADLSCRVIYHTGSMNSNASKKNDSKAETRRGVFGPLGLETLALSPSSLYITSLPHAEFLYRYSESHSRVAVFNSSREECESVIKVLGWTDQDALTGSHRVFLTQEAWEFIALQRGLVKVDEDALLGEVEDLEHTVVDNESTDSEDINDNDSVFGPASGIAAMDKAALRKVPDIEKGRERKKIFDFIRPAKPSTWKYPEQTSRTRKIWVCCTWSLTWWIPATFLTCCKINRPDIQMAFREKVALCVLIALMCGIMLFFIIGLGRLVCPKQNILSAGEISAYTSLTNPYVIIGGDYYNIKDIVQTHVYGGTFAVAASTFQV